MDIVLHAAAVYLVLLLVFALLGKRSLSQVTIFDFLILLIVSEATGEVLLGNASVTGATLAAVTLLTLSRAFDTLAYRFKRLDRFLNDSPLIIVQDGRLLEDRARKVRIDGSDVLERARELQGLERLEQIKYAVLERDGQISIVPR